MNRKNRPIHHQLISSLISIFALSSSLYADDSDLPEEIRKLNESYAREVARVLPPIHEKYILALEQILENYTKAGHLEDAIKTKKLIETAKRWEGLPLEQFRSEKNEDLSRSAFEDWLKRKSFSFRGVSHVTLEFGNEKVRWIDGGRAQEYDYQVRGKRSVVVKGPQDFRLEFVDDLSSGTFGSNLGDYDLTIVDRE